MGKRRRGHVQPGEYSPLPGSSSYDFAPDELEFMKAIEEYKNRTGRQFPNWKEVLDVLKALGYRKEPVKPCKGGTDAG